MLFVAGSIQLVQRRKLWTLNLLNAELNTICHFLALLVAHHIFHISRIRVKTEGHASRTVKCADYLALLAMEETVLQGMTE